MDAAALGRRRAHWQRHIERLCGKPRIDRRIAQNRLAGGKRLRHLGLQRVDRRTTGLALLRAHGAQRLQQFGDGALLAKGCDTHGFECGFFAGRRNFRQKRGFQVFQIGHGVFRVMLDTVRVRDPDVHS